MSKKTCWIMGGGPTHQIVNPNCAVFATNRSIEDYPLADFFVTMDYSFVENFRPKPMGSSFFIINKTKPYLSVSDVVEDTRFGKKYDLSDFDVTIKSTQESGFGKKFFDFSNGSNTGHCAIQLALLLGYKEIHLNGIDMAVTDRTHYHSGYGVSCTAWQDRTTRYLENLQPGLRMAKSYFGANLISHSPIFPFNHLVETE